MRAQTEEARAEDTPIAAAGFDSAAVAPADQFEAWCAWMAPSFDIRPAPSSRGEPSVWSAGWAVDDLVLGDLAVGPILYRRPGTPATERVLLRIYREGRGHGLFDDASFRTAPGEIHLFDQALTAHGVTAGRNRMQSLLIPYEALGYRPGHHPAHLQLVAGSATERLVGAAIEALFAALPCARRAEAPALAAGFCGLLRGLLLAGRPGAISSREFDAARRRAMRRYLEERLADPELGVASLRAAFGASRATIFRDFAEDGGVERFIVRRRLDRAYRDLASGPPDRGRVRRVAERWGFACPYHFSRVFRRQFDLSPSELLEAGRTAPRGGRLLPAGAREGSRALAEV